MGSMIVFVLIIMFCAAWFACQLFKQKYKSSLMITAETFLLLGAVLIAVILSFILPLGFAIMIPGVTYFYYRWKMFRSMYRQYDLQFVPRPLLFSKKDYPDMTSEEFAALQQEIKLEHELKKEIDDAISIKKRARVMRDRIWQTWCICSAMAVAEAELSIPDLFFETETDPLFCVYAGFLPITIVCFYRLMKNEIKKKRRLK